MTTRYPYEIDYLDMNDRVVAKVELPFMVKTDFESSDEFLARATRDLGVIIRFTTKFATRQGVNSAVADAISAQLKLHVTAEAAFVRAFISGVYEGQEHPNLALLTSFLDVLYAECIGNLPVEYKHGGLDPNAPKKAKKPKPKVLKSTTHLNFSDIGRLTTYAEQRRNITNEPLIILVPNPK